MDDRNQFRREIEDILRPQILAFTDMHLDLEDGTWQIYRQENMNGAEVYYLTSGEYDAKGVADVKQRLLDLQEDRR